MHHSNGTLSCLKLTYVLDLALFNLLINKSNSIIRFSNSESLDNFRPLEHGSNKDNAVEYS